MIAGRESFHLDERAFWRRFGRVEHERLEFKASAANLREVIPAMAMTAGGHVVLGVSDKRRLVGCPLDQQVLDAVMRRAQDAGVDVRVQPLVVGRVSLTLVTVPRVTDRIVTTSDGRVLRRVGSDNLPLRGEQLGRFVHRRRRLRIGRRVARLLAVVGHAARPVRAGEQRGADLEEETGGRHQHEIGEQRRDGA
jgi:predicted HTH transcriptional regulator